MAAKIALAAALSCALSGCIAAAIPLAAGGLIARSELDGGEKTPAPPAEIAQAAASPPAASPIVEPPAPLATSAAAPVQAPTTMGVPDAYSDFIRYALATAPQGDTPRLSALLAQPQSISADRSVCPTRQAAVLIDLDPPGALPPLPEGTRGGKAQLGFALAALRGNGIAVVWITDRPASEAGAVRTLLGRTGLDPTGADPLLVQRYPGETKQARRAALGRTHCLVAIAGDENADFDDLYRFLRDPALADPLKPLFDNGWFITPNPLD